MCWRAIFTPRLQRAPLFLENIYTQVDKLAANCIATSSWAARTHLSPVAPHLSWRAGAPHLIFRRDSLQ